MMYRCWPMTAITRSEEAKGDKVAKYDDPNRQARRLGLGNDSFMQARPGSRRMILRLRKHSA